MDFFTGVSMKLAFGGKAPALGGKPMNTSSNKVTPMKVPSFKPSSSKALSSSGIKSTGSITASGSMSKTPTSPSMSKSVKGFGSKMAMASFVEEMNKEAILGAALRVGAGVVKGVGKAALGAGKAVKTLAKPATKYVGRGEGVGGKAGRAVNVAFAAGVPIVLGLLQRRVHLGRIRMSHLLVAMYIYQQYRL